VKGARAGARAFLNRDVFRRDLRDLRDQRDQWDQWDVRALWGVGVARVWPPLRVELPFTFDSCDSTFELGVNLRACPVLVSPVRNLHGLSCRELNANNSLHPRKRRENFPWGSMKQGNEGPKEGIGRLRKRELGRGSGWAHGKQNPYCWSKL